MPPPHTPAVRHELRTLQLEAAGCEGVVHQVKWLLLPRLLPRPSAAARVLAQLPPGGVVAVRRPHPPAAHQLIDATRQRLALQDALLMTKRE